MGKVDGCWANVLDNCEGPLEAEHRISVNVWRPKDGVDTRKARERRVIRLQGGGMPPHETTVRRAATHVLCKHHNESTSDLDSAAGQFARALDDFLNAQDLRAWCPRMPWSRRAWWVDAKLVERWMLKTAITNGVGRDRPLGGPDAAPGQPTRELVEMVYGLRPVENPRGMFAVSRAGDNHTFREVFEVGHYTTGSPDAPYLSGATITFRTFRFGWQFEARQLPVRFNLSDDPDYDGAVTVQPLRNLGHDTANTWLRFRW